MSKTITINDHNPPLGVGNGCVQNETLSKECTIT